jgi:hypothetical protein
MPATHCASEADDDLSWFAKRTLTETLHDFYREPLARFQALEEGLKDRR